MHFCPDLQTIEGSFREVPLPEEGTPMGDVYPSCTPGTCAGLRLMANKLCILKVEFPHAALTAAISVLTDCAAFKPGLERQIQLERVYLDVIFKRV